MLNNIICKKLFSRTKSVFCFKLDLPKNYGPSQYIRRLSYIRNEDPNFKDSVTDILNNRYDLRKFLLAISDYGKNIQENIKAVVAGE